MLMAYAAKAGPVNLDRSSALPAGLVWLDLDRPTAEEEAELEAKLGFDLPTKDEMKDIEPSSRLYRENGAAYATATLLWRAESEKPETADVAFILRDNLLVTIRYAEPRAFNAVSAQIIAQGAVCTSGAATLANLFEAIVDRTAEILENANTDLDRLSDAIFDRKGNNRRRSAAALEAKLAHLARLQRLTAKARESLVSLGRAIGFMMLSPEFEAEPGLRDRLKSIGKDIQSLTDQASFISGNIAFMLDASLGLINVQQNAIIKIFSIAAVVLLPPTLVGTIYGMNFDVMPELRWVFGYPFALTLMVISALVPYLWFKRQGWL